MKKVQFLTKTVLLSALLSLPVSAFAGGDNDYYGSRNGNNNCGTDVPLDGGLSLLLAAGAGYGAKRYAEMRKKKLSNSEN